MIQKIQSNLPGKVKSKKGFTLAELLIVVAIIAILVAIAVPLFTAQLEKANNSTDDANIRAAKAAAVVALMDGTTSNTYFDADTGTLVGTSALKAYGKSKAARPGSGTVAPKGKILQVTFGTTADTIALAWVATTATPPTP